MTSGPAAWPSRTRRRRMSQCRSSPRLENAGGWLGKPRGNRRFGLGRGKPAFEYPGICSNSQKGPQREPSEADKIGPREHGFEPGSAFFVLLGSRMIGVEEQVRVDQDQR